MLWVFLLKHRVQLTHENKSIGLQHTSAQRIGSQLSSAHNGGSSQLQLAKQGAQAGEQRYLHVLYYEDGALCVL